MIILMRIKTQMLTSLEESLDVNESIAKNKDRLTEVLEISKRYELEKLNNTKIRIKDHHLHIHKIIINLKHKLRVFFHRNVLYRSIKFLKFALFQSFHLIKSFYEQLIELIINRNIFLFIAVVLINEIENFGQSSQLESFFKIFFEVISAYGNVGLSMGYGTLATSYCTIFTAYSKIILILSFFLFLKFLVMIMGRHRGFYGSMHDQNAKYQITLEFD
jgi:hypothetical protein